MGIDDFVRFVNLPRVSGRSEIHFLLRKTPEIRAFAKAVIHIPICRTNIRRLQVGLKTLDVMYQNYYTAITIYNKLFYFAGSSA